MIQVIEVTNKNKVMATFKNVTTDSWNDAYTKRDELQASALEIGETLTTKRYAVRRCKTK